MSPGRRASKSTIDYFKSLIVRSGGVLPFDEGGGDWTKIRIEGPPGQEKFMVFRGGIEREASAEIAHEVWVNSFRRLHSS